MRLRFLLAFVLLCAGSSPRSTVAAQGPAGPATAPSGLPATATGADIYSRACLTCHGPDGTGSPRSVVGFDAPLPDFADCAFATGEPDPDWFAVVHEGGPIRALDRHMPAFGQALSEREITLAIGHLRTFCTASAWPRGDLNLPRAFVTEKAFPENEFVWTIAFTGRDQKSVGNELIYERRLGPRSQVEAVVPIDFQQATTHQWQRGLGDIAFAFKHALFVDIDRGSIASAGVEAILPTGKEAIGLGSGYTTLEAFAMWGQILPKNSFLQLHGGIEAPTDSTKGTREGYLRTAVGTTIAQDRGFGRAWSPQIEVVWAKPQGGPSEWDVVPQLQVTLSKLQHVMVAGGVRIPLTERADRKPQALVYLLWDWFDGGFFDFWR